MDQPIQQWFYDIPVVTRTYLSAIAAVTLACKLDLCTPLQLFYNWKLVWYKKEYWRLITSFLYFGDFSFDLLFHMFFLSRYSRMLEEDSFRGKSVDYLWMLLFSCISIILLNPFMSYIGKSTNFLAHPLVFVLIYVWSRRNPTARMNMLGILNFNAPYLPFVLMGFPILLQGSIPWHDVPGLIVGHIYYFFEDVYPRMPGSGGRRPLATPAMFKALLSGNFGRNPVDETLPPGIDQADATPEGDQLNEHNEPVDVDNGWENIADEVREANSKADNPGGYNWGSGQKLGQTSEGSPSGLRKRHENNNTE